MLITVTDVVKAGPFRDFFRDLRNAIAPPKEKPRPHRSSHKQKHKHNEAPPSDTSPSQTSGSPVPSPSGSLVHSPPAEREIRMAKAASGVSQQKTELPYGTPVPGGEGLLGGRLPPDGGSVDVTVFP